MFFDVMPDILDRQKNLHLHLDFKFHIFQSAINQYGNADSVCRDRPSRPLLDGPPEARSPRIDFHTHHIQIPVWNRTFEEGHLSKFSQSSIHHRKKLLGDIAASTRYNSYYYTWLMDLL